MVKYGELGGFKGGRPMNEDDAFEMAIERCFGAKMRTDDELCRQVWSALANIIWRHENGDEASYTFRAGGDLVAAVRGRGDYMDWYMKSDAATVSDTVAQAMKSEGWAWERHPEPDPNIPQGRFGVRAVVRKKPTEND